MVNDAETLGIDPAMGHPERALALGYAPQGARGGVAALFALDATLAHITRTTRDPLVAQMRLTWWYEALVALDTAAPPAQPILRALAAEVLPRGVTGAALAGMVDGWEALLDAEIELSPHAAARGATLFAAAGTGLGLSRDLSRVGEGWALADLALTSPDAALAARARTEAVPLLDAAMRARWPGEGRALGALALVARMDLAGTSPPGAPQRVARLAWHRLTGR